MLSIWIAYLETGVGGVSISLSQGFPMPLLGLSLKEQSGWRNAFRVQIPVYAMQKTYFFFFFLSWSYYSEVLSYYLTLLCVWGCWWDVNEDNDNFKLLFWRSVPAVRTRKHHPLTQSLRHVPLLPSSLVKPAMKGAPAWASQGRISCSCFPYP